MRGLDTRAATLLISFDRFLFEGCGTRRPVVFCFMRLLGCVIIALRVSSRSFARLFVYLFVCCSSASLLACLCVLVCWHVGWFVCLFCLCLADWSVCSFICTRAFFPLLGCSLFGCCIALSTFVP